MRLFDQIISNETPLFLIAGPCVIENEGLAIEVASALKQITEKLGLRFIFKASYDKANRTSIDAFRGPGLDEGLRILQAVKDQLQIPVLTDVHESTPVHEVAAVVDVLQTPAFLARQTDFIERVAKTTKPVNVKKAQFMAPWDMNSVVEKYRTFGNSDIMVCERGVSFGYNTLVSDMRSLATLRETGCPVVYDATHSVQLPGRLGSSSGGQREMIPLLARAAVAAGVSGIFMEVHPRPDEAFCDGPNSWPLYQTEALLRTLIELDRIVKDERYREEL